MDRAGRSWHLGIVGAAVHRFNRANFARPGAVLFTTNSSKNQKPRRARKRLGLRQSPAALDSALRWPEALGSIPGQLCRRRKSARGLAHSKTWRSTAAPETCARSIFLYVCSRTGELRATPTLYR